MSKNLRRSASVAAALGLALSFGLATPASADPPSTGYATTAATYDLLAGQDQLAGQVLVWDVDGDAYVQFVASHDWCILETNVAIGATEADIPQTSKGNPIPGQFAEGDTFGDCAPMAGHYVFEDALASVDSIVVAAHAKMRTTLSEGPSWAAAVVTSSQGLRQDGSAVDANRSEPTNALVSDYVSGGPVTFFSLGFGGMLTADLGCMVLNGDGDDLTVYEATNGTYPAETAMVEASMDGSDWVELGTATNGGAGAVRTTSFDLGSLPYATQVRVTDTSDPEDFASRPDADAFDLDGIEALQGCVAYESAWADGDRFVEKGNWATYAGYTKGDGTIVGTGGQELTFLVFDLGDQTADLGGMAWFDGPQQYAVHTVCSEVAGNEAWFTYQIPGDAPSAPGQWVTFRVVGGDPPQAGYTYSPDMATQVAQCNSHAPISPAGYTGSVFVHPGA